ncbi:uncharacterized protein [Temnothorax nylanderi]|uniref:uncharacterized protein n=1 Tax=Temnothorax nylanderi TaxID=102681 RepID=UPI003A849D41
MKMRPTVNSDESVSADRSVPVARYPDHSSRRPKEQISASKNAQTEYEAHLSQNAAYSSTYGPSAMPLDQPIASPVSDIEEGQRDVTRNPEKTEQKHIGTDTRDIDSSRYRSKSCVNLRLWCLRLCRAKKRCSDRVLRKPAKRVLERIKARSKECGKPDDTVAVAGVSTMPHRESISYRDAPKKSRRGRKQDEEAVEVVSDRDVSEEPREERKERRKREREERKREAKEEERRQRRERRKREEHVPRHPVDARPMDAHDDDLGVEDRRPVPVKPPSIADFAKSCCYLCAQNTLAIAAATAAVSRPEQSDKCVQVSAHKFHAETSPPTLDKSCSPMLLVLRTVQSSVKVRTRETSTLCPPGTSAVAVAVAVPRAKKRKKFAVFPGLTRTKCPAGRHAACETDKSTARRDDNAEKREPRNNEGCCGGERNV